MKIFSRTLVVWLFGAPILYLGIATKAQVPRLQSALPRSPVSSGILMARAIESGRVQLPGGGAELFRPEFLTCSPAPCALPNVQASEGGAPVNEDPIKVNPTNTMQLLTGGYDFNCSAGGGHFSWLLRFE